jgi:hypothetical protein
MYRRAVQEAEWRAEYMLSVAECQPFSFGRPAIIFGIIRLDQHVQNSSKSSIS